MLLFNVSTGCRHIITLFQAHGVFASDETRNELLGRTAQLRYYPVKPLSAPLPKGDLALVSFTGAIQLSGPGLLLNRKSRIAFWEYANSADWNELKHSDARVESDSPDSPGLVCWARSSVSFYLGLRLDRKSVV